VFCTKTSVRPNVLRVSDIEKKPTCRDCHEADAAENPKRKTWWQLDQFNPFASKKEKK